MQRVNAQGCEVDVVLNVCALSVSYQRSVGSEKPVVVGCFVASIFVQPFVVVAVAVVVVVFVVAVSSSFVVVSFFRVVRAAPVSAFDVPERGLS
jgi:hypothetical protein